ncbi:hypothetical protein TSUD_319880 [Trifolium subterraneum]|uniref:Uncharacterized protein n=1 Tax=Trifolium subterraneum TaxID=3900 RepID=A0A2Z6MS32_TRISU|nr:hypothetical protein TSUD_319880 [Trifolium subterraneum]
MALSACCNNSLPSFPFKFPSLWPTNQKVKMGPLSVSPMGFGTWAWGNQLLWGASLDRMQIEQIGIGQLHWSTANYAPFQELALWDGLVAMYDKSSSPLALWDCL